MGEEVFLFEPDLLFSSRIESAAIKSGLAVRVIVTTNELQRALQASVPRLLLVDLDALAGSSLLGLLKGPWKLVGYYSHADSKLASQALACGFNMVIPRRSFVDQLNEIFANIGSSG
jgi:DNA-binding NarL/FixJ family response regulator